MPPARIAFSLITAASLVTLVIQLSPVGSESVEPVTPERIAETAGATTSPFADSLPCNVYVVPLDRPSEDRADDVARALAQRLSLLPCALPSLALDAEALDLERGQLDASLLTAEVREHFLGKWADRPSTVVGVTEHDLFSSGSPDLRFVFGFFAPEEARRRGFAVISTARMGTGEDSLPRLETMAMRYVGLGYFGLELTSERSSALYETIRSGGDLDRMRPQFADPPPSDSDLRAARARYLAGG